MAETSEDLRRQISEQIEAAKQKLDLLQREITDMHEEDMAAFRDRQTEVRERLDQQKSRARSSFRPGSRTGRTRSGHKRSTPSRPGSKSSSSKSWRGTPSARRTTPSTW
jgi:BMFP domain-containing protein YqiC